MPLRRWVADWLDPEMVRETELEAIIEGKARPTVSIKRFQRRTISRYAWGTDIVLPDSKAWEIFAILIYGTATETFQPTLTVSNPNYRLIGGQVDQNDGYQIIYSAGIEDKTVAVLAGLPNQFVQIPLPQPFMVYGMMEFGANTAGIPDASLPNITIDYYEYDLTR